MEFIKQNFCQKKFARLFELELWSRVINHEYIQKVKKLDPASKKKKQKVPFIYIGHSDIYKRFNKDDARDMLYMLLGYIWPVESKNVG